MLAICWLLAVPVRLCSEYRLFRQSSTELLVIIASGSGSSAEGGGTVWFGPVAGEGWGGVGISVGSGGLAQAPANITTATRPNMNILILILIALLPTKTSVAQPYFARQHYCTMHRKVTSALKRAGTV